MTPQFDSLDENMMKLKETVIVSDENKYINLNEDHRKYFEGLLKGSKRISVGFTGVDSRNWLHFQNIPYGAKLNWSVVLHMEKFLHEILPLEPEYRMESEAATISLLLDVNHYNCLSHIYINQNG